MLPSQVWNVYQITNRKTLLEGFSVIDFVKVGEDYNQFMKWFLMPALIDEMFFNSDDIYKDDSVKNGGLPKVD